MARKRSFEGSPKDMALDRKGAKKAGMTMKAWEGSPADEAMDASAGKAFSSGGSVRGAGCATRGQGRGTLT